MEDPISAERLSWLIGLIYDCAIDPGRWSIALEAIRIELSFQNASLELIDLRSLREIANLATNVPEQYLAQMQGATPDVIELWGGEALARSLPLDKPAVMSQVNPAFNPETSTNGYYLAFAKPQQINDVMAIGLARDAHGIGTVSFGRHQSAGPIGAREIQVAKLLIPHLQRAATINRLIDGLVLAQSTFSVTLDTLSVPVFLVDLDGRVLFANLAAKRQLDLKRLVRIDGGLLTSTTRGATSALSAAIRAAAEDASGLGRRGLGIPVLEPESGSGALHVLPLSQSHRSNGTGAVAAVFVAQVDTPFVPPTELAAALFNLTPSEARVFQHIVSGNTQSETAAALGVGRSTVKSHLLRLFDKVGVRRQADLVQVAASLSVPVAS
jgi:DNA-binding CsgD family transcriptional regulator/PAS domain-containing protein